MTASDPDRNTSDSQDVTSETIKQAMSRNATSNLADQEQSEHHQSTSDTTESDEQMLSVDNVSIEFSSSQGPIKALRNVSINIRKGETLGIAGESGSGKSTLALAIMQALDENGKITQGSISFKDKDLCAVDERELRSIRGDQIAHVAQNPQTALNRSHRVGQQIKEAVDLHQNLSNQEAWEQVYDVLDQVNIPDPEQTSERYPHELSGGQQQRVVIAMALSCNPELLILDEPTTGLDVTTQAKILDLIDNLKTEYDASIILITHDLGVISTIADQVTILYAGEVLEKGTVEQIFTNPTNPYTQGLLASTLDVEEDKELKPIPGQIPNLADLPDGCIFADRCSFATEACHSEEIQMETVEQTPLHETRCMHWETAVSDPIRAEAGSSVQEPTHAGSEIIRADNVKKHFEESTLLNWLPTTSSGVRAVDGLNLSIQEGETVGLVGESGCGKSTFGRSLLGLHDLTDGAISYRGENIATLDADGETSFRANCQMVFQNPESSLNPRKTVYSLLARPLEKFTEMDDTERNQRVIELLEQVNLSTDVASKYPDELSGGQQQRVAIAHAFAVNPSFVVLDEPVSSLDVSVTASILDLLQKLQEEYNTSYLFISHDMSAVKAICDRIAVMYLGEIVEQGTVSEIFSPPHHPYTRALLSSIPSLDPHNAKERVHLEGDVPSARDAPSGCSFHTRCPKKIGSVCETDDPELTALPSSNSPDHCLSCHLDEDDLSE